jgi:hypothetical protein
VRDYSKVSPQFWIGQTGRKLRKQGVECQLVSLYLMTCPHANMLGLFYLPKIFISHECGLPLEGAMKGLQGAIEAGFCSYDEESEMVWVHEMASYQIGQSLDAKDNRCKGVQNEYDGLPECPYLPAYFDKYGAALCMTRKRGEVRASQPPSKPLRSQEQEQEQEQDQEQEQEAGAKSLAPAGAAAGKNAAAKDEPNPLNLETWLAYKQAYSDRYQVPPIRDAATNAKIKTLVRALGDEAPAVAAFFVSHNGSRYVGAMHQIGLLATDYAKLRTEWATNTRMTATKAQQADKTATNADAFAPLIAEARAREEAERNAHV